MDEGVVSFGNIKDVMKKFIKGKVLVSETVWSTVLLYLFQKITGIKTTISEDGKSVEECLSAKLADVVVSIEKKGAKEITKFEKAVSKNEDPGKIAEGDFVSKFGPKFLAECEKQCRKIKIEEKSKEELLNEFGKCVASVYDRWTVKPLYGFIWRNYWKNFEKFFGGEGGFTDKDYEDLAKAKVKQ